MAQHMWPQERPGAERFADAVRALFVAWRAVIAYPERHPAIARSLADAHQRLTELVAATGPLPIGISRQGLQLHGIRSSSRHAMVIAGALYARQVAVLGIEPGITPEELEAFLRLLETHDADAEPVAFASHVKEVCRHLAVTLADYSIFRLTDSLESVESTGEREALWERLVAALIAKTRLPAECESAWDSILEFLGPDDPGEPSGTRSSGGPSGAGPAGDRWNDPANVAASRLGSQLGLRLAVTEHPARVVLARHVSDFARGLPDALRDLLLASTVASLPDDPRGAAALEALASPLEPPALLAALRTVEASGAGLSTYALGLLGTLSALGASAEGPPGSAADAEAGELASLYRNQDIDRYNPEDHRALLDWVRVELPALTQFRVQPSADLDERLDSLTEDALAAQLADTLLELLAGNAEGADVPALFKRVEGLLRLFVTGGRLGEALGTVHALASRLAASGSPAARIAMQSVLARLAEPAFLASLVAGLPRPSATAIPLAKRLVETLGDAAVRSLVLLLTEEVTLSRRRRSFDLLVSLGPGIVSHVSRWLFDARWYVVRNMIALLRAVEDRSLLPLVRRHIAHPQLRVRLEVLKTLMTLDAYESRDVLRRAIHAANPRVAELVVSLAGKYGTPDLMYPLLELVSGWDAVGRRRGLRLRALRALGELGDPRALPRLARFFRPWKLPFESADERRAAFESLHGYPADARAPLVAKGLRAGDPAIRETCRRLAQLP